MKDEPVAKDSDVAETVFNSLDSPITQLLKKFEMPMPLMKDLASMSSAGVSDVYRPLQFEQLLSDALTGINRCLDLKLLLDDLYAADANQKLQTYQETLDRDRETTEQVDEAEIYATRDATATADWIQHGTIAQSVRNFPENGFMGYRDALVEIVRFAQNMYDNGKQGIGMGNAHISALTAGISALQLMERESANERRYRCELAMEERRRKIRKNSESARIARKTAIENGKLGYDVRISRLVNEVLAPSLIDIREKCEQSRMGLKQVFNLDVPQLPNPGLDVIESYAGWIRARVNELTKIAHFDQGFTYIKSIIPSQDDLKTKRIIFRLDDSVFADHAYVRIRGVSAFVESDKPSAQFRLKIFLPQWAIYIDARRKQLVASPQEIVPACVLGRCASRMAIRPPEVGATTNWINASPISATVDSHWRVEIEPIILDQAFQISEIQIELQLVGRPYRPD